VCIAETNWVKRKNVAEKKSLKYEYAQLRKRFNREIQTSKRHHWYSLQHTYQNDLLEEFDADQVNILKYFG